MASLASLLFGLAVLLVAMTGFTAMFGADKLRDRLAGAAVGAAIAAIFLPYAARTLTVVMGEITTSTGSTPTTPLDTLSFGTAFVLGHVGLASAWAYARVGPPIFLENIARARGRGRERVAPAIEPEAGDE